MRPPPRSRLFPYTTLFRSRRVARPASSCSRGCSPRGATSCRSPRSEEHTSELQSRGHLVCRLLLEKKTNHLVLQGPAGRDSEVYLNCSCSRVVTLMVQLNM